MNLNYTLFPKQRMILSGRAIIQFNNFYTRNPLEPLKGVFSIINPDMVLLLVTQFYFAFFGDYISCVSELKTSNWSKTT